MKEELENRLLEKEATLLEQLQAQKEGLILEKGKIEESLRETMEKAIEEKNKTLEEELIKQKEKLESVILQKETEQKMLETQLNEVKEEKNKQTEAVLHAKEDILSNFAELMETELQCSICNELFVQVCNIFKANYKRSKEMSNLIMKIFRQFLPELCPFFVLPVC